MSDKLPKHYNDAAFKRQAEQRTKKCMTVANFESLFDWLVQEEIKLIDVVFLLLQIANERCTYMVLLICANKRYFDKYGWMMTDGQINKFAVSLLYHPQGKLLKKWMLEVVNTGSCSLIPDKKRIMDVDMQTFLGYYYKEKAITKPIKKKSKVKSHPTKSKALYEPHLRKPDNYNHEYYNTIKNASYKPKTGNLYDDMDYDLIDT